ncbi:hypothetical protein VNI00_005930 [Paramarasmius palmivorus]|uniref:SET domain-containing protein n=1 Tax=Paramarasmius palmivorus TaxID=297713 RepID=A0AAW0DF13_9AGAR
MKRGFLNSSKAKKAIQTAYADVEKPASSTNSTKKPQGRVRERVYVDERVVYLITPEGRPEQFLESASKHRTDYEFNELVCTTLPAIANDATVPNNPDGWTECLVTGGIKRLIYETPGFPKPLVRPQHVSYRIGESPGKGLGMFATRDLKMGELILSERPIIILPLMGRIPGIWADNLPRESLLSVQTEHWKKTLQHSFRRLTPEKEAAFWNLMNAWPSSLDKMEGILRTNGFNTEGMEDKTEQDMMGMYRAVGEIISRINHSCEPSVERRWDTASFSFQLRATRDIKAGEECFIQYCDNMQPYATRKEHLDGYMFECTCPSCLDPASSDARRALYAKGKVEVDEFMEWCTKRLDLPDDFIIKKCQEQLDLLDKDGLQCTSWYESHLMIAFFSYMALGDRENARIWGRKLGTWRLAKDGPAGGEKYEKEETYGKEHPFWQMRLLAKVKAARARLAKRKKA